MEINVGDQVEMNIGGYNNSNAPGYNRENVYNVNAKYIIKFIYYDDWATEHGNYCTLETVCGKFIRFNEKKGKIFPQKIKSNYEIY